MSTQTAFIALAGLFGIWVAARAILGNWPAIKRALTYWFNR